MADKADRMREDMYYIAGKVNVPEEKREEFNRYVLELLYKCGIRRLVKRKVNGRSFKLVEPPKPDKNGIVKFNYSIFEKKERKINTYNMNTCELVTPDRGYDEFGVAMNLIMVLQECYSDGSCYFMSEGTPCYYVDGYLELLNYLLGVIFDMPHRRRAWEVVHFFGTSCPDEDVDKIIKNIFSFIPYMNGMYKYDSAEAMSTLFLQDDKIDIREATYAMERSDINENSIGYLHELLYMKITDLLKNGQDKAGDYIGRLITMDKEHREELAKREDEFGIIAEISLYALPPVLVHAYGVAIGKSFWDVWNDYGIDGPGYRDIIRKHGVDIRDESKAEGFKLPYYKAIRRNNQDEFLEFWDGDNLILSENMKNAIQAWKETFHKLQVPANYDTEKELADILTELDELWNRRCVDLEFVEEVKKYKKDDNYKKALMVLRGIMDSYVTWFPELTRNQANEWIAKSNRVDFDYKEMQAFTSLMINHKQRKNIFGF